MQITFLLLLFLGLTGCRKEFPAFPGGLVLEESALAGPPNTDAGSFQPEEGAQEEILARHQAERARQWTHSIISREGFPALVSLGEGMELTATLRPSREEPDRQIAEVREGEQIIFSADAGLPSPAFPLQGLWSYGDQWVLEILLADETTWKGEIFLDGVPISTTNNYQEAFGFQLMAGKPFYFFRQDDQLGFSYNDREANLPYGQIAHYQCCSGSTINPIQAREMVAFFAQRGAGWYYAELGTFSP